MGWVNDARKGLAEGRQVQVRPVGGSMRGRIESGQLVTLAPVDTADVRVDDVRCDGVRGVPVRPAVARPVDARVPLGVVRRGGRWSVIGNPSARGAATACSSASWSPCSMAERTRVTSLIGGTERL